MEQKKVLEQNEQLIWLILMVCRGRERALTAKKIRQRINGRYTIRQIRSIIQALIEDFGYSIAATSHPPYGYYIPQNEDEIKEYANNLKARIRSIAYRLKAFEKNTADSIIKELSLFETKEGS